jgi:predicted O-methyltransferase YrrM
MARVDGKFTASVGTGDGWADGDDALFGQTVEAIAGAPWMTPSQGRRVWNHIRENRPTRILDIGTCYGTSAAYMAAACKANGTGRVITVDSGQFDDQVDIVDWCRLLWDRCGVADRIDMVRIPHSNYAWWLMEQVAAGRDETDRSRYDFVYLDGAKWLALDAAAVIFIEQLLRPGGWLLMDDLDWTYEEHPELKPLVSYPDTEITYSLSDAEAKMPHLRAVFDLVVKKLPSFTQFVEQDGQWGWAQKLPGAPRRVSTEGYVARSTVVGQFGRLVGAASRRVRRGT